MQGRRVPVVEGADPGQMAVRAGDYYGPVMGFSGDRPAVFFRLPGADEPDALGSVKALRCVCSPPHSFHEQPDGSLTIRDSILAYGWEGEPREVWHGHLTGGVWEKCG